MLATKEETVQETQRRAIELGLTGEQVRNGGHSWYNHSSTGNIGSATIEFLKDRILKGESPVDAFEKIKGVNNEFKIQAIQLGLNREDLEGLDWNNTDSNFYQGSATIEYLRKCPIEVTLKRALANIRGDKRRVQKIIDNQNAGITAGLDPIQVYAVPLTTNQIIKITNGKLYNDVVPEGAKFILELEQRKEQRKQYTIGAASEAISEIMEIKKIKAPEEVDFGARIASHLTTEQGEMLAKVTTKTLQGAKTFEQMEINRQTSEREEGGQNR